MIKKYFKIFKIKSEYENTFSSDYQFESVFRGVDENQTKDQCEQVIEHMGITGEQYAIVEIWQKGKPELDD